MSSASNGCLRLATQAAGFVRKAVGAGHSFGLYSRSRPRAGLPLCLMPSLSFRCCAWLRLQLAAPACCIQESSMHVYNLASCTTPQQQ